MSQFNEGPFKVQLSHRGDYKRNKTCPDAWAYRSQKGGVEIHVQVPLFGDLMAHWRVKLRPARRTKATRRRR